MAGAWRLLIGDTRPLVPWAVAQLRSIAGGGSPGHCGASACPGHLGHALSVLAQYGQWDAARPACRWLLATQWGDGSFADPGRCYAAVASTAQAVRGLLDIEQNLSPPLAAASPQVDDPALVHDIEAAVRRACDYLAQHSDPLRAPRSIPDGPPEMALAALPCLVLAARRWHVAAWEEAARATLSQFRRTIDLAQHVGPTATLADAVEALLDMHACQPGQAGAVCRELAREAMALPAALASREGWVPACIDPGRRLRPAALAVQAQMACLWYRLGEYEPARATLDRVRRQLARDRPAAERRGRTGSDDLPSISQFLKASLVEVEASFEREVCGLPAAIDPRDGRMHVVREWFARLDPRSSLVDAGCGPGRFLAQLAVEFPAARFTGVDTSSRFVSGLPHGIEGRRGSLLNLPAADGQFDAALAVESLEHALLAQRAADELCRVVRPGGSILIIDKDLARQGLSEHEPWEQWFAPHEVAGWLSRHCTDVAVRQVCHVPAYRKRPLFLAWTARRSGSSIGRSIA